MQHKITINPRMHSQSHGDGASISIDSNQSQEDVYLSNLPHQLRSLTSKKQTAQLNQMFILFLDKLNQKRVAIKDECVWDQYIKDIRANHPLLLDIFHSDPFTKRCFDKPRGYSGDAVTLDLIYQKERPTATSVLGEQIFEYLIKHDKTTAGVRMRAQFIGGYIDNLFLKQGHDRKLNVLSIACGHLRELDSSQQFWNGNVNVAGFDQDALSLNRLQKDYVEKGYNVATIEGKIRDLFSPKGYEQCVLDANDGDQLDLVWSAGLYDYLNDKTCQKLTKQLFDMVKPGGKLLIGNFMPSDTVSRGYMECFMDWKLVYREVEQIKDFAQRIDKHQVASTQIHEQQNIAFIEITKSKAIKSKL
eukprot:498904_1